jgi:hypothetical protein
MNQRTVAWGLGLSLMPWVPAVWSQGQIAFGNRVTPAGIDAPVFDTDCRTRLAGPSFLAQLYFGREPYSLAPVGDPVPFRTGAAAGYFTVVAVSIPDTSGLPLFFRVRAWEAAAGSSYVEAMVSGKYGESNLVVAIPVWPPGTPADLVGLTSFCLVPEPSPSLLLLMGAGLAGLSVWRPRR